MFDSLNLSVTALVVLGLVISIVFIFAAREAASWFFKIDDLKKDVKKVGQLVVDMEAEVRLLQGLLSQTVKLAAPEMSDAANPPPTSARNSSPTSARNKEEAKTRFFFN